MCINFFGVNMVLILVGLVTNKSIFSFCSANFTQDLHNENKLLCHRYFLNIKFRRLYRCAVIIFIGTYLYCTLLSVAMTILLIRISMRQCDIKFILCFFLHISILKKLITDTIIQFLFTSDVFINSRYVHKL